MNSPVYSAPPCRYYDATVYPCRSLRRCFYIGNQTFIRTRSVGDLEGREGGSTYDRRRQIDKMCLMNYGNVAIQACTSAELMTTRKAMHV